MEFYFTAMNSNGELYLIDSSIMSRGFSESENGLFHLPVAIFESALNLRINGFTFHNDGRPHASLQI